MLCLLQAYIQCTTHLITAAQLLPTCLGASEGLCIYARPGHDWHLTCTQNEWQGIKLALGRLFSWWFKVPWTSQGLPYGWGHNIEAECRWWLLESDSAGHSSAPHPHCLCGSGQTFLGFQGLLWKQVDDCWALHLSKPHLSLKAQYKLPFLLGKASLLPAVGCLLLNTHDNVCMSVTCVSSPAKYCSLGPSKITSIPTSPEGVACLCSHDPSTEPSISQTFTVGSAPWNPKPHSGKWLVAMRNGWFYRVWMSQEWLDLLTCRGMAGASSQVHRFNTLMILWEKDSLRSTEHSSLQHRRRLLCKPEAPTLKINA